MGPDKADPDDLRALASTYQDLYQALDVEGPTSRSAVVQAKRVGLDFLAVTDGPCAHADADRDPHLAFRLIDEDTVPVVVCYGTPEQQARVEALLAALRTADVVDVSTLRAIQPWTTNVRRATAIRPDVAALLRPVATDLVEWVGGYDEQGMVLNPDGQEFIA